MQGGDTLSSERFCRVSILTGEVHIMDERELNDIVNILDGMVAQDISRIKVSTSDEVEEGSVSREYHHGRCDIGSPWARGCAFDVLE